MQYWRWKSKTEQGVIRTADDSIVLADDMLQQGGIHANEIVAITPDEAARLWRGEVNKRSAAYLEVVARSPSKSRRRHGGGDIRLLITMACAATLAICIPGQIGLLLAALLAAICLAYTMPE